VYKKLGEPISIIDLPGIYSLSPYTPEEVISRNYILDENPDCVINIVDATNLERNLYLTTQVMEMDVPLIVALNMSDVVRKNGDSINAKELSEKLGVPVVEISALKGENIDTLMSEAYKTSANPRKGKTIIQDKALLHLIKDVDIAFRGKGVEHPLFHAIKLVELDELEVNMHPELVPMVDEFKATFENDVFGNDFEAIVADARYQYIAANYANTYQKNSSNEEDKEQLTKSDKIDKVLTHRIWAIPIFIVIMFFVFHFTFSEDLFFMGKMGLSIDPAANGFSELFYRILTADLATPLDELEPLAGIPSLGVFLQSWMGALTGAIMDGASNLFALGGDAVAESWYASLVVDGLLNGLDAVMSFIPQILLLFLFIAILEDSGYMARVAFILDRAFRKFGLSGKAFIPMLSGFGCSVPAIMATRTLENEKEKDRTIRLITCFSCGAKAPIWTMLAAVGVLGGFSGDLFVFTIYIGGIAAAVVYALFMKLLSKDQYVSPFIMELPAYHAPQFKNVMAHLWEKLKHYVIKAATIIAASLIVIWFLSNFRWAFWQGLCDIQESMLADIGRVLGYFFYPLGFSQNAEYGWMYSVASVTGLVAKEDVVGTLASLFGMAEDLGEAEVGQALLGINAPAVWSFAVFNLFTIPCFAAIATAHGEQSRKEFWLTMLWWFAMSYVASALVYWLGSLYAVAWWGGLILTIVLIGIIVAAGFVVTNRNKRNLANA
ncbi:MAG: ferrous iron transporter B, partial [Bacilli bacterium]|nr:ferrous iron transporter B [Bacilli bacterium]